MLLVGNWLCLKKGSVFIGETATKRSPVIGPHPWKKHAHLLCKTVSGWLEKESSRSFWREKEKSRHQTVQGGEGMGGGRGGGGRARKSRQDFPWGVLQKCLGLGFPIGRLGLGVSRSLLKIQPTRVRTPVRYLWHLLAPGADIFV